MALRWILVKLISKYGIKASYVKFAVSVVGDEELDVLDVGGASGVQAFLLFGIVRCSRVVVLDVSKDKLVKGKELRPRIAFVQGDAHHLPFRSGSFDLVASFSILEHLENPVAGVKEQIRVSRRLIAVQIPNLRYYIEPHTLVPLLYWYPKKIRQKVLKSVWVWRPEIYINFSVTYKNLRGWFHHSGIRLIKTSKLYHANYAKIFVSPQGYLMLFEK